MPNVDWTSLTGHYPAPVGSGLNCSEVARAQAYLAVRPPPKAVCHAIRALEGRVRPNVLVDLGCGPRLNGALCVEVPAWRVVGIDVALPALLAQPTIPCGAKIVASVERIPLRRALADIIVAIDMIHYVESRRLGAVFREVRRVLRTGGRFYVATQTPALLRRRFENRFFSSLEAIDRVRCHSVKSLTDAANGAGLGRTHLDLLTQEIPVNEHYRSLVEARLMSGLRLISDEEFWRGLVTWRAALEQHRVIRSHTQLIRFHAN